MHGRLSVALAATVMIGASSLAHAQNGKDGKPPTVISRFPELTLDDALDLTKVQSAFERATPDLFSQPENCVVFYKVTPKHLGETSVGARYHPGPNDPPFAGAFQIDGGKARYTINIEDTEQMKATLPLLLWGIGPTGPVLVAPDGGRYEGSISCSDPGASKPGLGVAEKWSPPLEYHSLVGADVAALESAHQLPEGTLKKLDAARIPPALCYDKIWARYEPKFSANQVANISRYTRENRANALNAQLWQEIDKTCGKSRKTFDQIVLGIIAVRDAQRKKLYDAVVPHVKELASHP